MTFAWDTKPSSKLPEYAGYARDLWRSPCSEEEYYNDILDYGNTVHMPNKPFLSYAIFLASEAFRLPVKVPMIKLEDVFTRTDLHIWKSSPGLPWKEEGYMNKGEIRRNPAAVNKVLDFWKDILDRKVREPDDTMVVNKRHITKRGTHKIRAIMCYPATMTFGEVVFYTPLTEKYVKGGSPIAFGYETLCGGAMRIFRECFADWYTASDFKAFDKSVPVFLLQAAFNILKSNINFDAYENSNEIPDSQKMEFMFDYIRDYFIHTPFRLFDGYRYKKHGGIASGSGFTQLIGSIVNYILIQWASLEQQGVPSYIKVFGDDSICGYSYQFHIMEADKLFESIRMHLHQQKSRVTRNISELSFLGFQINYGYPKKEFDKWMASLLYPETNDKEWKTVASRALSLLYCCCGFDLEFDEICRKIIAKEKFEYEPPKRNYHLRTVMKLDTGNLPTDAPSPEKLRFLLTEGKLESYLEDCPKKF
ncbi:uncharacterized protein LOC141857631 [Brevipalpus obovatus]|uniref:uncharacterized protein LOC141857631 n=1 Tax=Brevipalpus obovatus TaxID=246614 RepID=UPI003D9E8850